ncbi:MAG: nitrous oxide reductase family maturation protein NosD [Promethearchaeota archaeon]
MKKSIKQLIILAIVGICIFNFALFSFININFKTENENGNLKISAPPIYIDDTDPSYNWSIAKDAGICTGEGTYSEPYLIEGVVIDGTGLDLNLIMIENSDVFFRIENCILQDVEGLNSAIRLSNVDNGQLINNNCTIGGFMSTGIRLDYSNNITISGTICRPPSPTDYGGNYGIALRNSINNTVSGNILDSNNGAGIYIYNSNDNFISGNTITAAWTAAIDITYYSMYNTLSDNIISGGAHNGIRMGNSNNNTILRNTVNDFIEAGIYVLDSHYSIISENTANNNGHGIKLENSDYNIVTGNNLRGNDVCIEEIDCENNVLSDNTCGGEAEAIPGYLLFWVLGAIFVGSAINILIIIKKKRK